MEAQQETSFFTRFVIRFSEWSIRWIPDSMVFVLGLTLLVYVMAWFLTPHGPYELVMDWVKGFWVLLTFAMQMCFLMITGFVVADSKQMRGLIIKAVTIPKTRTQAIVMYCLFIGFLWWLHWGIGMMTGLIMGRELAARNRGMGLHYPIIAAISYAAIQCTNGPSMAAQLLIATPGHFMEKVIGVIPISETTFHPHLLLTNVLVLIVFTLMFVWMHPDKAHTVEISEEMAKEITDAEPEVTDTSTFTPAQKIDNSFVLPYMVCLIGFVWIANFLWTKGIGKLDLNILNFILLMIGLLLHKTPRGFMASVQRGVGTVAGVIVQFPFYAGIFGIIQHSGLAGIMAGWFVSISTTESFPWVTFVYSAILNIFVPSGGSKFVIEAPYLIPAAKELSVHIPYVVNAYTYGDELTNLIQPFWALPILGAYKLKFQDILPYGFTLMIPMFIVMSFGIYFLPMIW